MINSSAEKKDEFFNNSPAYLFVFSEDNIIIAMNVALLDDLGYTSDEVIGKLKIEQLLNVGSKIFLLTHFLPQIKLKQQVNEIFLNFKTTKKTELPVLFNVKLSYQDNGSFVVHCGGIQISQRNHFEKELIEAKKTAENALLQNKELIAASKALEENRRLLEVQMHKMNTLSRQNLEINKVLSHDLQEPLRKLITNCNIILEQNATLKDSVSYTSVNKIAGLIVDFRSMIDKLQHFQTLEGMELQYSTVDLKSILVQLSIQFRKKFPLLELDFNIASIPAFIGDKVLITRVFNELITNAINFRRLEQNTIQIVATAMIVNENIFVQTSNAYQYEKFIKISFSDDCSGFNSDHNKIFEIFMRDGNVDQRGIGLPICKKIVELHNGRISVASSSGVGSIFTILLPI